MTDHLLSDARDEDEIMVTNSNSSDDTRQRCSPSSSETTKQTEIIVQQQQAEHLEVDCPICLHPEVDCPICLHPMRLTDHAHALQCKLHCGYNFCLTCIESLIQSSKDDYMEASDGNYHVKVYLHCPNCRSNLSETIRDTVLLRRAANVNYHEKRNETLTPRQNRMKLAMEQDAMVQQAVAEAAQREAEFFGWQQEEEEEQQQQQQQQQQINIRADNDEETQQYYEEWGVEADVIRGPHDSFHCPSPVDDLLPVREEPQRKVQIDTTLLQGLDFFLTKQEQESVTELFSSGDPNKLAIAAEFLREVSSEVSRNGGKRSTTQSNNSSMCSPSFRSTARSHRRGSIYQLVSEAQRAHLVVEEKKSAVPPPTPRTTRRDEIRRIRQEADYLKLHPLPVRMPKAVQLRVNQNDNDDDDTNNNNKQPLTVDLIDGIWDGTVMDAFSKITVSRQNIWGGGPLTISQKQPTHNAGVRHILGGANNGTVRIALEQPRIIVAAVHGDAGQEGVVKGDVLTHWNGQALLEGETASSLTEKIQMAAPGTTLHLTLNCDQANAQALKRRAFAD